MSNQIEDWKKAAIVALNQKYGSRAIGNRIGVCPNTVRRYRDMADEHGFIEMKGTNLEIKYEN